MTPATPSPAVAALIGRKIDEMPTEGILFWRQHCCKEQNALLIYTTPIYLWAIRPDGVVLWMDHESTGHPTEPETNPQTLYRVLSEAARVTPEFKELVPPCPGETRPCTACGGSGATEEFCWHCDGAGWVFV